MKKMSIFTVFVRTLPDRSYSQTSLCWLTYQMSRGLGRAPPQGQARVFNLVLLPSPKAGMETHQGRRQESEVQSQGGLQWLRLGSGKEGQRIWERWWIQVRPSGHKYLPAREPVTFRGPLLRQMGSIFLTSASAMEQRPLDMKSFLEAPGNV